MGQLLILICLCNKLCCGGCLLSPCGMGLLLILICLCCGLTGRWTSPGMTCVAWLMRCALSRQI